MLKIVREGPTWGIFLSLLIIAGTVFPNVSAAAENDAVEGILDALLDEGVIDEGRHAKLLTRHIEERENSEKDVASGSILGGAALTEGWSWNGDFRARVEDFQYDHDKLGVETRDRTRFRYRLRFGFAKQIHDWLSVNVRLASGVGDHRSTNQTIGDDENFDPDDIFIDRAFLEFTPDCNCDDLSYEITAGKVPNPFMWKNTRDLIVWDSDINPEGISATATYKPAEATTLFATLAAFIVDENSAGSDPKVVGLQLGGQTKLSDTVEVGGRASGYQWTSLDSMFITTAATGGNISNGFGSHAKIGETSAYAVFSCWDAWPVRLWGTFVRNFSADNATIGLFPIDQESDAHGFGIEVGSSKKYVKLGLGYYSVEANAVIASFTDSDLFDGFTNRHGWTLYGSKKLTKNTEVKASFFDSNDIQTEGVAAGPYATSISAADRKRARLDFVVKY